MRVQQANPVCRSRKVSRLDRSLPRLRPDQNTTEDEHGGEIDPVNIIATGRRTRGVKIDFAAAAKDLPEDEDDEDEADDDFEDPAAKESDVDMKDK